MNRALSVYLDLVRFCAACLVYVYHSNMRAFIHDVLPLSQYGHSSVIVFFVLSGFVIAYVADTKESEWTEFAASRLSRIYSVVLPAVALTLVLDLVGRSLRPDLYDYPFDQLPVRIAASLGMLNEAWFVSITYLSNVPYWSVTYESWYYVLFGLVFFLPGRTGWWAAGLVAVLIGPKLLLLLPIWAAGVFLYRWRPLAEISAGFGFALAAISFAAIPAFHILGVFSTISDWTQSLIGNRWFRELTFSRYALGDYLLCILVVMNFAGMRRIAPMLAPALRLVERPVRAVAAYTFTLYLLHQPLFLFWGAVIRGDNRGPWYWISITVATALSVALIGHFTENKRHALKTWCKHRLEDLRRLDLQRRIRA